MANISDDSHNGDPFGIGFAWIVKRNALAQSIFVRKIFAGESFVNDRNQWRVGGVRLSGHIRGDGLDRAGGAPNDVGLEVLVGRQPADGDHAPLGRRPG